MHLLDLWSQTSHACSLLTSCLVWVAYQNSSHFMKTYSLHILSHELFLSVAVCKCTSRVNRLGCGTYLQGRTLGFGGKWWLNCKWYPLKAVVGSQWFDVITWQRENHYTNDCVISKMTLLSPSIFSDSNQFYLYGPFNNRHSRKVENSRILKASGIKCTERMFGISVLGIQRTARRCVHHQWQELQ